MGKPRKGILRRPVTITGKQAPRTLKPQHTRQLIRRFHVLQKYKHRIILRLNNEPYENTPEYKQSYDKFQLRKNYNKTFDVEALDVPGLLVALGEIDAEEKLRGGLNTYQIASTQGQDGKRGGDSSKKLIEWIKDDTRFESSDGEKVTALEIGCLSPHNMISTSGIFDSVTKIDLNAQSLLITSQDFMKRPLPVNEAEKFNLVSCSLVINFVPTPKERGDMLMRITKFLKTPGTSFLFLVLPLPCIENSRYFNEETLHKIITTLGFTKEKFHRSNKLAYWLLRWDGVKRYQTISKKTVHEGSNRNNFSIVLT